jgi:PAS domain-containing protein
MDGQPTGRGREGERARRRAARELVAAYHDEQLRVLLERVRDGFARLDAGEIDAFDLDDLIHHYKRASRELWKFCGSSGSEWARAARSLAFWREQDEEPDWWEAGAPRRRRNNG